MSQSVSSKRKEQGDNEESRNKISKKNRRQENDSGIDANTSQNTSLTRKDMDKSAEPGIEIPKKSNETEHSLDVDGCSYGVYKCLAISLASKVAKLDTCNNYKHGKLYHFCQNNYVTNIYGEQLENKMGMTKMCKTCVDKLVNE